MQKAGWILGILAALAGLYPTLEPLAARIAYTVLDRAGSAPSGADVIVLFSGGGAARVKGALDLLEQGFASRILVLGTEAEMRMARSMARERRPWGPGRIVCGTRAVRGTAETVAYLSEWMESERVTKALVVSDGFHLPRISSLLARFRISSARLDLAAVGRTLRMDQVEDRRVVLREFAALVVTQAQGALTLAARL